MATYQEERERFVDRWARNGGAYHQARGILKHAKTIDRAATSECNGTLTRRQKLAAARAECTIAEICEKQGFSVHFGGDPRGYTTKIAFPDGSYNSWGGVDEGWGVPTR